MRMDLAIKLVTHVYNEPRDNITMKTRQQYKDGGQKMVNLWRYQFGLGNLKSYTDFFCM